MVFTPELNALISPGGEKTEERSDWVFLWIRMLSDHVMIYSRAKSVTSTLPAQHQRRYIRPQ